MIEKRNFTELASEFACDNFRECHEAGLRVGSADPSTENEGVAAVEGDGRLEVDRSRRVRHVISGEIPYLALQLSVF
jgi:hypothetical protein